MTTYGSVTLPIPLVAQCPVCESGKLGRLISKFGEHTHTVSEIKMALFGYGKNNSPPPANKAPESPVKISVGFKDTRETIISQMLKAFYDLGKDIYFDEVYYQDQLSYTNFLIPHENKLSDDLKTLKKVTGQENINIPVYEDPTPKRKFFGLI